MAEKAADPRLELLDLLAIHRIVEREHRHGVSDLAEALARRRPHALRRRGRVGELGVGALERLEPTQQRVVFRVGDLRAVEDVVEVVVPFELQAELGGLGGGAACSARAHRGGSKTRAAERRTDPFLPSAALGDPRESPITVLHVARAPIATLGLRTDGVKKKKRRGAASIGTSAGGGRRDIG